MRDEIFYSGVKKTEVLTTRIQVPVRFNEADPSGIVWYGHCIRYFEDAREVFGKAFGISYQDFYSQGLVVPVVSVKCDFKKPLRYGDVMNTATEYESCAAATVIFHCRIHHAKTGDLVATGTSVQVFVNRESFQLHLTIPDFFREWNAKWNVV